MAFTSDNRPHTLGDLIVITGTVANGDTNTDLSDFMSEILFAQVLAISAGPGPKLVTALDGTTVHFEDPAVAAGGKLFAIGKR
jgi:hypothetical protein